MDWQTPAVQSKLLVNVVCVILILAAYIDGKQLKVPNWITFPMVLAGLAYNLWVGGWAGLGGATLGMFVGLACLLPLYAVGGMGAGDVKLMAGVGAWLGATVTFYAFCVSVIVGAVIAVAMVLYKRDVKKHYTNLLTIVGEWLDVRDPRKLSAIAAKRKSSMLLLPYGIPICIGCIGYFLYQGMLF